MGNFVVIPYNWDLSYVGMRIMVDDAVNITSELYDPCTLLTIPTREKRKEKKEKT